MHGLETLKAINADGAAPILANWIFDGGSTYGGSDAANVAAHSVGRHYPLVLERIERAYSGPLWRILGAGIDDALVFADRDHAEKIARRLSVCARVKDAWVFAFERLATSGLQCIVPEPIRAEIARVSGFTTWDESPVSARMKALAMLALYRGERGLSRLAF